MTSTPPETCDSDDLPSPADFAAATQRAFDNCPNFSGLHLLTVDVQAGFLTARFEGPIDDFRGPYGAIVQLPADQQDPLWATYAGPGGTVDHWAHSGVAMRALDAHTTSRDENRGYTSDGMWWLIDDIPSPQKT